MNILVCIKSVPETAEADLELSDDGASLETDDLVFGINEWDNYAVEEAVRLKEAHGGSITVMTIGDEEAESVLRRALAMGADQAVHLCDDAFEDSDTATLAMVLEKAIADRDESFDLILTGVQSSDLGQGQTGVLLAQRLGLPYATLAVRIEVLNVNVNVNKRLLAVTRELEANTQEKVELPLPAVITVQSGINQPRYVSIMGIRKVRSKPLDEKEADDLDLDEDDLGFDASQFSSRKLATPTAKGSAVMLEGNLPEVCTKAAQIIREKGGLQ